MQIKNSVRYFEPAGCSTEAERGATDNSFTNLNDVEGPVC